MGLEMMNANGRLLSTAVLLQTGVVVFAYLFGVAFGPLIMPAPLWSEVMREKGLLFLFLPVVTGVAGTTLLAKEKERYLLLTILVASVIAIGAFIALVEAKALTEGPRM